MTVTGSKTLAIGLIATVLLLGPTLPAAAEPANASADDAARSEMLIRELLKLTGSDQMMDQVVDQMFTIVRPQLERSSAGKPAGYVDEWYAEFKQQFLGFDFNSQMVSLYQKHFSADELSELVEFHRSPLGQKSIAVMPAIMQESMAMGSQMGQQAAMKANEIMNTRYQSSDGS